MFRIFALTLVITAAVCFADDQPAPPTDLQRLVASAGTEPLLVIGIENAQTLPEKFKATNFGKMLNDKDYKEGLAAGITSLNNAVGLDLGELLQRAQKLLSGPVALELLPEGDGGLKIVLYALTASEDTARELNSIWPKDAPDGIFSICKLQTVLTKDLPEGSKLPEWAATKFPSSDFVLRALPKKLNEATQKGLAAGKLDSLQSLLDSKGNFAPLAEIDAGQIDTLAVSAKLDGDMFLEQVTFDVAPDAAGTFAKVITGLREKPKAWDSLMAALPGDQDLTILLQGEPKSLGDGLPLAVQSLERYLRGKKWARKSGKSAESLDSKRYDFIFDRLNGEMGIIAKGSLTGQFNVTLATAMKAAEDAQREELTRGLDTLGATFETLKNVRTIGSSPPLGALFQGRGLFSNPLIGLSKGWAWLCSSLSAYQDLTASFGNGTTLGAIEKKTAKADDVWRKTDTARIQINLERVIPPLYVAWTLSGEAVPTIGSWHIPPAMLVVKFSVFNGRLGMLRSGVSRTDRTVTSTSRSSFPGTSLVPIFLLQQLAREIDDSRQYAATPAPEPVKAPATKADDKSKDDKKQAHAADPSANKGQP
jgi:hypothetical protein